MMRLYGGFSFRRAGQQYGWLLGIACLVLSGVVVFGGIRLNAPLARFAAGSTTKVTVIAREPGVAFNTLSFCNDPKTTVVAAVAHTEVESNTFRYIASRPNEQINWLDSPVGQNPNATRYWTNSDPNLIQNGLKVGIGGQASEPVEITKDSATCFKKKAGVK